MKPKSRILSLLLAICLVVGLMPTAAFAAGTGAIQLGTDILKTNANTSTAATVYYGGQSWRVIGYDGTGVASSSNSNVVTLITAGNPLLSAFDSTWTSNAYASSTLKTSVEEIANRFSDAEKLAVVKRTLESGSYNDSSTDCVAGAAISNALLWPLSTAEADSMDKNLRIVDPDNPGWATSFWWLRSPGNSNFCAAAVAGNGDAIGVGHIIHSEFGVRPAFNLDLNAVLFTSAAVGGKSSGNVGTAALNPVSTTTPTEWKLTLLDSDRHFTAATTAVNGNTLTLSYSDATTGANEYISAIVKDNSGNITHYGRLKNTTEATDASGTVTIDLSGVTMAATDTLYVFSEQYNGGADDNTKLTDYASALVEVSQTKNAYAITNNLTNISTDNAAAYRLMSETADYTATLTVYANYTLPTSITVKVGGNTLTATTDYTYNSGTGELTIPNSKITEDIEITAAGVLPVTTYALTVNLDGGSGSTTGGAYAEGAVINIDAGSRSNYRFDGWTSSNGGSFADASSASTAFTMPAADTTVTANWRYIGGGGSTTDYYRLTFDTNGGSEIASIRRVEHSTIDLADYTPTREGYEFTGWYADENLTEKITSIRLTRNTTVYAGWEENPSTGFENPFTDVSESDWFFGDVKFVYQNGLMNGTSSTTFSPDGTTSRGMIVTILWRMAGSPDMKDEIFGYPFQDVDANAYYATAVYWARLNGITDGYGDNTFGPDKPITREQMAVMLYRYAQHKGYDTTQGGMAIREYADYGQISAYALEAMDWANATGIVSGTSESILSPQGQATRAQAAAMLTRFCKQYAEK